MDDRCLCLRYVLLLRPQHFGMSKSVVKGQLFREDLRLLRILPFIAPPILLRTRDRGKSSIFTEINLRKI